MAGLMNTVSRLAGTAGGVSRRRATGAPAGGAGMRRRGTGMGAPAGGRAGMASGLLGRFMKRR